MSRRRRLPANHRRVRLSRPEDVDMSERAQARGAEYEERMRKKEEEAEATASSSRVRVDNVDDPTQTSNNAPGTTAAHDGHQATGTHIIKRKHDEPSEQSRKRREAPAAASVEPSGGGPAESLKARFTTATDQFWIAEEERNQANADKLEASERKCEELRQKIAEVTQDRATQARRIAEMAQENARLAQEVATLKANPCI
ncbi:hypothetical protein BDP55DRAFT_726798 [Colletotrichum godetiae]|uniref:Uncharacterized protein n=1 Tax=Colletotrichum godetiae TaxID=1209918 RepID=A0AAJ0AQM1_9PEZI|nr:uncharacterized protein BDP55DRAFT_726798 [Colletotrichum godetiae]KAK1687887.1 hypothetical protein BDP55DRAFT_726798 [Colletotrichum godetiae]